MWDGPSGEGLSRIHIIRACEDSLRRLQTDVIDLYLLHWSGSIPIAQTLEGFMALRDAGKFVLAVDYAVRADHVRAACDRYRAERFAGTVTALELDRLTAPCG